MKTWYGSFKVLLVIMIAGISSNCFASDEHTTQPATRLDPITAIIKAFDSHDVVAMGERHLNFQDYEFRVSLIQDPRFAGVVNDIVVECGNALYQDVMDRFISGENVTDDELRKTWSTTTQGGLWSASNIYENFFRAVREVNLSLPKEQKLRVLLGDPPFDIEKQTEEALMNARMQRDSYPAGLIQREVIAKGRRALVVYGAAHFYRKAIHYKISGAVPQQMAEESNEEPRTLVALLERSGVKVFTIFPEDDGKFTAIQPDIAGWDKPAIALIKGTILGETPISAFAPDIVAKVRYVDASGQEQTGTLSFDPERPVALQEQYDAILVQKGQTPSLARNLDSSKKAPLSMKDMDKLSGEWQGEPVMPQGTLDTPPTIVCRFSKTENGQFTGSFSRSLEEDGAFVSITEMGMSGNVFSFKVPDNQLEYMGKLSDKEIVGELKLPFGEYLPLTLKKK